MVSFGKSAIKIPYRPLINNPSRPDPVIAIPILSGPPRITLLVRSTPIAARLRESSSSTANMVDSRSDNDQSSLTFCPKKCRANPLSFLPMYSRCGTVNVRGAIRASSCALAKSELFAIDCASAASRCASAVRASAIATLATASAAAALANATCASAAFARALESDIWFSYPFASALADSACDSANAVCLCASVRSPESNVCDKPSALDTKPSKIPSPNIPIETQSHPISESNGIHDGVWRSGTDAPRSCANTSRITSGPSRRTPTTTSPLDRRSSAKYESRRFTKSALMSSSSRRINSGSVYIDNDQRRIRMLGNLGNLGTAPMFPLTIHSPTHHAAAFSG